MSQTTQEEQDAIAAYNISSGAYNPATTGWAWIPDPAETLRIIRERKSAAAATNRPFVPAPAPRAVVLSPVAQMNAVVKQIQTRDKVDIATASQRAIKENPKLYEQSTHVSVPSPHCPHFSSACDKVLAGVAQAIAKRDGLPIDAASRLAMRENSALFELSRSR